MGYNVRGEHELGLDAGRRALALAEELGLGESQVRALNLVGWARAELDEGLDDLERSVELGRSLGIPEAHRSCANLAHHLRHRGEFQRSVEFQEEALRLADRFGDAPGSRFEIERSSASIATARDAGTTRSRSSTDTLEEVGIAHLQAWVVLGTRGLIRLSSGDDGGLEELRQRASRPHVPRSIRPQSQLCLRFTPGRSCSQAGTRRPRRRWMRL